MDLVRFAFSQSAHLNQFVGQRVVRSQDMQVFQSLEIEPRVAYVRYDALVVDDHQQRHGRTHAGILSVRTGKVVKLPACLLDSIFHKFQDAIVAFRLLG